MSASFMQLDNNWRNKSIEMLEKRSYEYPAAATSPLMQRCIDFVKIPTGDLTIEQLRTLISQEIGLPYTVRLAQEQLHENILVEGDLYEGDLLKSVIAITPVFWQGNEGIKDDLKSLVNKYRAEIEQQGIKVEEFLRG